MAKMTDKNTKAEILRAYEDSLERLKQAESQKFEPEKVKTATEKAAKVEKADTISSFDPTPISHMFENAVAELKNAVDEYAAIKDAIAIKKSELNTLYGIEAEAGTLFSLANAKDEIKANKESELQVTLEYWNQKISEAKADFYRVQADLETERKRNEEEYDYAFNRKKAVKLDTLEDELKTIRTNFYAKLDKDRAALDELTKTIAAREQAVSAEEDKSVTIEQLKAALVDAKDSAKEKAIAINSMKKEFEYEKSLLLKDSASTITILENKIEGMEAMIDDLKRQNAGLSEKLNIAYGNIKDIASETTKSSANASTIAALKDIAKGGNSKI